MLVVVFLHPLPVEYDKQYYQVRLPHKTPILAPKISSDVHARSFRLVLRMGQQPLAQSSRSVVKYSISKFRTTASYPGVATPNFLLPPDFLVGS